MMLPYFIIAILKALLPMWIYIFVMGQWATIWNLDILRGNNPCSPHFCKQLQSLLGSAKGFECSA